MGPAHPDIGAAAHPAAAAARGIGLDIALTARCPLNCRFCTVPKADLPELSAAQWHAVIESYRRLCRVEWISLEGGEPMRRADLQRILLDCLAAAGCVKIVTSGAVPLGALPRELVRHPRLTLEVSVDGPKAVHDLLRDGSWNRAWRFIQDADRLGANLRLRSVVSVCNIDRIEGWLKALDRRLTGGAKPIGYRFDTLIAPQSLRSTGGPRERLGLRDCAPDGLVPHPADVWDLYRRLKARRFRRLRFEQNEPFRGCGACRLPSVSFDPCGHFSFCCEAPRGFGSILEIGAPESLRLLEEQLRGMPCPACGHLREGRCNGCFTGQKCGMVGYWNTVDCATLLACDAVGRAAV
jgi:hypothetical protein